MIQAIADAREHGDLKENAEYHAAREQQGFIEGRIAEIEGKLAHAVVIDIMQLPNTGQVVFGATVTLCDLETDQSIQYRIVGEDQADVKQGLISATSPIARALIGKDVQDMVTITVPGGQVDYEILAVEHRVSE